MRKLFSLFTLLWAVLGIFAQTQELPDLQVSGEFDLRTYLNKRALLFSPLKPEPDSMITYLPQGIWSEKLPPREITPFPRNFVQLEANTGLGLNSYLSHYPRSESIYSLTHQLDYWTPADRVSAFRTRLNSSVNLASILPLSLEAILNHNTTPDFRITTGTLMTAYYRSRFITRNWNLSDYNVQLTAEMARQKNQGFRYKAKRLNLLATGIFESGKLNLKHTLIYANGHSGIVALPEMKWKPEDVLILRPGFVADANAFIPTIEFKTRTPLTEGLILKLENKPTIYSNNSNDILLSTPWTDMNSKLELSPVPLNLSTILELFDLPGLHLPISMIKLENNLQYVINSPQFHDGVTTGVPAIHDADLLQNTDSVTAMLHLGGLVVHQNLKINLAYLPEASYQRAAYQPLLEAHTYTSYDMGFIRYYANIQQFYFSVDHNRHHLPEAILCDLGAEYQRDAATIYLSLANILNMDHIPFKGYPVRDRSLFLGVKYRF